MVAEVDGTTGETFMRKASLHVKTMKNFKGMEICSRERKLKGFDLVFFCAKDVLVNIFLTVMALVDYWSYSRKVRNGVKYLLDFRVSLEFAANLVKALDEFKILPATTNNILCKRSVLPQIPISKGPTTPPKHKQRNRRNFKDWKYKRSRDVNTETQT